MEDINIKVELTGDECRHLINMLKYLAEHMNKLSVRHCANYLPIINMASNISTKVFNSLMNSPEVSLFCAQKEQSDQALIDYVNRLIKGGAEK